MLAYLLALVVAAGSLVFYLAAFFLPEIHRRQDFIWSGVGLFYALVLWSCAGRLTGAVLLGQMASVALLGGLAWQTLALRREMTPVAVRTVATWQDAEQWLEASWAKLQSYFQGQSLTAALGTLIQDLLRASDVLRQRIAGPRGQSMQVKKTSAAAMPSTQPLQGLLMQIATLTGWVGKPLQNFRKPKPKRAVIDIPPREPSIPRSPGAETVASESAASVDRSQSAVAEQGLDQEGAINSDNTEATGTPEIEMFFVEGAAEVPNSPDAAAELGEPPLDEVTNWDDE